MHEGRPLADTYSKRYLVTTTNAKTGKEKNHLMDRQSIRVIKRGSWQPQSTISEVPEEIEDLPEERRPLRNPSTPEQQAMEDRFLEIVREVQRPIKEEGAPAEENRNREPLEAPGPERQRRKRKTALEMLEIPRETIPGSNQGNRRVTRSQSYAASLCAAVMEEQRDYDNESQLALFIRLIENVALKTLQTERKSREGIQNSETT